MKSSTKPFPKTKIQWLWENMEGKRALYLIGMIGTVVKMIQYKPNNLTYEVKSNGADLSERAKRFMKCDCA